MKRIVVLALVTIFAATTLAIAAGPASAEGHYCRWWTPDPAYGGYWLYLDCPQDAGDGRYVGWYPEVFWHDLASGQVQWF